MKNQNIKLFFRKKTPQFNSIEGIFFNLYTELKIKGLSIETIEVPNSGAGIKDIIQNLKFSYHSKGKVNHITGHINYVALVTGRKTILTVHDIGSALKGDFFHRIIIKTFWFWIPALFVNKITVISETSKTELERHIPFARNKMIVLHNPVNKSLRFSPKKFNSENPVILHIGTKANKNLERTIAALEGIKCRFLVVGALTEEQLELLEQHKINYRDLKYVPFSEIKVAYEECDMLSFATLYEGFGMPVIEAQAVGRPVLSSNLSSIPEIAGKGACLVNPESTAEIRKGILRIIQDETYRNNLIMEGRANVRRFQLEEIALQYINIYKEVANA